MLYGAQQASMLRSNKSYIEKVKCELKRLLQHLNIVVLRNKIVLYKRGFAQAVQ